MPMELGPETSVHSPTVLTEYIGTAEDQPATHEERRARIHDGIPGLVWGKESYLWARAPDVCASSTCLRVLVLYEGKDSF